MTRLRNFTRRYLSDRKGASAIEFALISPVLIMMLFGVLETGRILYTKSTLQRGVEIAARYAMVNQTATASQLQTIAYGKLMPTGSGGTKPTVAVTTVTVSGVDFMVISSSLSHKLMIPLMTSRAITLKAESRIPLE